MTKIVKESHNRHACSRLNRITSVIVKQILTFQMVYDIQITLAILLVLLITSYMLFTRVIVAIIAILRLLMLP